VQLGVERVHHHTSRRVVELGAPMMLVKQRGLDAQLPQYQTTGDSAMGVHEHSDLVEHTNDERCLVRIVSRVPAASPCHRT